MFISLLNVLRRRSHTIVVRSFSEKQYTKLKRGFIIWVSVFGRQTAFDCLKTDASTVESISSTFSERSHLSLSSPKGKDSTAQNTASNLQASCLWIPSSAVLNQQEDCFTARQSLQILTFSKVGVTVNEIHGISCPSDMQNFIQGKFWQLQT